MLPELLQANSYSICSRTGDTLLMGLRLPALHWHFELVRSSKRHKYACLSKIDIMKSWQAAHLRCGGGVTYCKRQLPPGHVPATAEDLDKAVTNFNRAHWHLGADGR